MPEDRDYVYKEIDAGNKELFSMFIYRPLARLLLLGVFRHVNTTPNVISFLSLSLAVAASYYFACFSYPIILIGVLLLHLVYTFDMLDGQYARYRGMTSKYGRWLDPFLDDIKISLVFITLSYRAYSDTLDYRVFIWGTAALVNALLTFYILNTRGLLVNKATFEVKLKKNIYVGYEISLYWVISFFVIINKLYPGLIVLATFGALSWIKCFVSLRRYYFRNKEQIEKEKG
jgi:phosphatidylglycerophosphate synthase